MNLLSSWCSIFCCSISLLPNQPNFNILSTTINSVISLLHKIRFVLSCKFLKKFMEGRSIPSGFSTIVDHASSSNPRLWSFSVFGGIFMCKIVYELTGIISPFIFKGFTKLQDARKLEWKNRGFSTLHALFVAIGSVYLLVISDLFDEHAREDWIVNRSSPLSDAILGFLHHGLSLLAISQSLLSGQIQFYILIVLFTEITTPFVHLRWYLDVAGKKNSTLYLLNGFALFVGWLAARVILFVFFFSHMYAHLYQVKQVYPMGY